jgi:Nucleotidyl transferase AbiEii toxin, Type IV TA system
VKFELLADLDTEPAEAIIKFTGCQDLGAVNLRGTGNAARDSEVRILTAVDDGVPRQAEVNVAGLGGFLLAKAAAAHSRRKPKDWYDIAFVLLHNDHGDVRAAAERVRTVFGPAVISLNSALEDLKANFGDSSAQGTAAYVGQITLDHPDTDPAVAAADGQLAVRAFCDALIGTTGQDGRPN